MIDKDLLCRACPRCRIGAGCLFSFPLPPIPASASARGPAIARLRELQAARALPVRSAEISGPLTGKFEISVGRIGATTRSRMRSRTPARPDSICGGALSSQAALMPIEVDAERFSLDCHGAFTDEHDSRAKRAARFLQIFTGIQTAQSNMVLLVCCSHLSRRYRPFRSASHRTFAWRPVLRQLGLPLRGV
jgi:hypothetical protein